MDRRKSLLLQKAKIKAAWKASILQRYKELRINAPGCISGMDYDQAEYEALDAAVDERIAELDAGVSWETNTDTKESQ